MNIGDVIEILDCEWANNYQHTGKKVILKGNLEEDGTEYFLTQSYIEEKIVENPLGGILRHKFSQDDTIYLNKDRDSYVNWKCIG